MARKSTTLTTILFCLLDLFYYTAFWDNFIDITLQQALVKTPFECRYKALYGAKKALASYEKTKQ